MKSCSVTGCGDKIKARGLCNKHYLRVRAHGSPDVLPTRGPRRPATPEGVWARLRRRSDRVGECLLWQGATRSNGYGLLKVDGRDVSVHRASYEVRVGPIPEGMEIHHKCHVRNCIEPLHLEVATRTQNAQALKGAHGGSSSGVRGVHWDSSCGKWRARAHVGGKRHYSGSFDTVEEAGEAAKALRKRLGFHGEP